MSRKWSAKLLLPPSASSADSNPAELPLGRLNVTRGPLNSSSRERPSSAKALPSPLSPSDPDFPHQCLREGPGELISSFAIQTCSIAGFAGSLRISSCESAGRCLPLHCPRPQSHLDAARCCPGQTHPR